MKYRLITLKVISFNETLHQAILLCRCIGCFLYILVQGSEKFKRKYVCNKHALLSVLAFFVHAAELMFHG